MCLPRDRLQASWHRAWTGLGARGDGAALRDRLLDDYSEPHRSYHTLQHLGECIAHFEAAAALARHGAEVELALWFHDAVHAPRSADNEMRSADRARHALVAAGVAGATAARVHALVLATRHAAMPASADERLLVDIDLAILSAAPERFDEYEAQVRREYAWVEPALFDRRRSALLEQFLARRPLYGTAHFRDRLESQARENLRRSIGRLGN